MTTILVLNAATNQEKLTKLYQTVQKHFNLKERVIITVPNKEAADYLDLLLWRLPQESFLPHKVSETSCDTTVVITTIHSNINQAKVLLNLLPSLHPHYADYPVVYEIFDATDPSKKELSQKKIQLYHTKNIPLHFH